ncbi:MAG: hypothetical protein J3Q66DRAFT_391680 [Benniella sp.]|nr:MAG: hypothetical protein J3Q66DRAFT_391680 [Benniella sp.]
MTHHVNAFDRSYSKDHVVKGYTQSDRTVRLWDASSGECLAVVRSFPDEINCVSWSTSSDPNYLVTGSRNGSVLKWQVIKDEDKCRVQLQWSVSNGPLTMTGASIQGACGLTTLNKQLLKQRGAMDEPEHLLRETSKKVITMVSVVFKLKETSEGTVEDSPSTASLSVEQQEQLEQLVDNGAIKESTQGVVIIATIP